MLQAPKVSGIAGVDEAGVGPWAGPVFAAAVTLEPRFLSKISHLCINDSKKLTAKKREEIFLSLDKIKNPSGGFEFSVAYASVQEIDELNIRKATHLAMYRALKGLTLPLHTALIDGNHGPEIDIPTDYIIKGDQKILSIAIASIIAKVHRDHLMETLHKSHPNYGWNKNAGYGTKLHREALEKFGVTIHHRKSYAPIRKIMEKI